jgi:hypothetical protein
MPPMSDGEVLAGNSQEVLKRPATDYRPLLRLPLVEREAAKARWLAMGMPEHTFIDAAAMYVTHNKTLTGFPRPPTHRRR